MTKSVKDVFAEIEADHQAHPWRYRLRRLWVITKHAPARTRNTVVFAWQRVTRGWDDASIWSLDYSLTKQLGAQLIKMAEIAHGYPAEEGMTIEKWQAQLFAAGAALTLYANTDCTASDDDQAQALAAAQWALTWVASNLQRLWD